jgi:hypothetical protein
MVFFVYLGGSVKVIHQSLTPPPYQDYNDTYAYYH